VSAEKFIEDNWPHVRFVTFTQGEALYSLEGCKELLRPFTDTWSRGGYKFQVYWEIQEERSKREGVERWHAHVLINKEWASWELSDDHKRAAALGWGTQSPDVQRIKSDTAEGLSRYVCKRIGRYLTKADKDGIPKRVRLTGGSRSVRVGTVKFGWRKGLSAVYRAGCQALHDAAKKSQELYGAKGKSWSVPGWSDARGQAEVWRIGCIVMGLSYVDVMHRLLVDSS
jgi:hypothetical protein